MENTHVKHTHFQIQIELRFLGIPTRWAPFEDTMQAERLLLPAVSQDIEPRLTRFSDPREIRTQFLKMEHDEISALSFLDSVGVWSAIEDRHVAVRSDGTLVSGDDSVGRREMLLMGSFGHRDFIGRALPLILEELWAEQEQWRRLLRNPAKLKARFLPPPSGDRARPGDKYFFGLNTKYENTLPVHLEWQGKHPRAVVQPITGRELLIALAWIDVVSGAEFKVCQKCGTEYTWGGRKFCTWQCEHANTMRTYRAKKKKALRKKSTRLKIRSRSGSRVSSGKQIGRGARI